jgi:hypothetical protein
MNKQTSELMVADDAVVMMGGSAPAMLPAALPDTAKMQMIRMFRDPYVLDKQERAELVQQLREAVALEPQVAELRVLLGMALCVDLDAQAGMEELRGAVEVDPENFLARLKFGEILMRLRVCAQAAEETQIAAQLATNAVQAELARRQAATLRTMQREGIERGGYGGKVLSMMDRIGKLFTRGERNESQAPVVLHSR